MATNGGLACASARSNRFFAAHFERPLQALNRVTHGNEFLAEVPIKPRLTNGVHDGWVMDLLIFVDLMPARISGRVIVGEVLMVVTDRTDQVSFHDLHVIDVVEQLNMGRVDPFDDLDAPGRAIALIVEMVDFAIEKFEDQIHPCFLGGLGDSPQAIPQ